MNKLVIAPHADDEVLGVGGTIARFVGEGHKVTVAVLTGHGDTPHPLWPVETWDTIRAECQTAAAVLGVHQVVFGELPAACLDHTAAFEINRAIGALILKHQPEEVYLPFAHDLHQDHGAVAYGVSVATRPYLVSALSVRRVLAYETLSETHLAPPYLVPSFQPNVFIDITNTLETKLKAMRAYGSQLQADSMPRSIAALRALATLRGTHIGVPAAEAFVLLGEYNR